MKRRTFTQKAGMAASALAFGGCSVVLKNVYKNYEPSGEMPKRIFGETGMKVSMLSFGSHLKKELIARPEYRDRMIKLGFECGINVFDVYDHNDYKQFKPVGMSLRGFRKEVLISLVISHTADKMQEEIHSVMEDFHTDYIDLYRLSDVDDESMNILEKNKKAGKIRAIGVVSHGVATMMKYVDRYQGTLDFVMIIYNFHHNCGFSGRHYPYNDYSALIPRCEKLGLGIIGIKPMGSNAMIELARKNWFFKDKKANLAQAMLRHIYKSPEIHTTMPAMNSFEELITNLESAFNPEMSREEKKVLDRLSDLAASTRSAYLPHHYTWLENWSTKMV